MKDHFIEFFRKNNFNCFPIPEHKKEADYRYKASKTVANQVIKPNENYGVIPMVGSGNCILDFDDKEEYRQFAELMIKEGWMVIESPHGWHIPVRGLSGGVSKTALFNYKIQDKKIVEIQGYDHYCVGVGSTIIDKEDRELSYISRGSEKIWDQKGKDFHEFIDFICRTVNVEHVKKLSTSSYKNLRDKFKNGEIPDAKQSNDYFHQASRQCLTDGKTIQEARDALRVIYHKWSTSEQFSDRPWSNIEQKINEVYDDPDKFIIKEGRPKKEKELQTAVIARRIVDSRNIYSDVDTDEIFENKNGFLELINNSLVREMLRLHPEMKQS